jgi:hypothetical protein
MNQKWNAPSKIYRVLVPEPHRAKFLNPFPPVLSHIFLDELKRGKTPKNPFTEEYVEALRKSNLNPQNPVYRSIPEDALYPTLRGGECPVCKGSGSYQQIYVDEDLGLHAYFCEKCSCKYRRQRWLIWGDREIVPHPFRNAFFRTLAPNSLSKMTRKAQRKAILQLQSYPDDSMLIYGPADPATFCTSSLYD